MITPPFRRGAGHGPPPSPPAASFPRVTQDRICTPNNTMPRMVTGLAFARPRVTVVKRRQGLLGHGCARLTFNGRAGFF
jgi:hypothetical protein